VCYFITNKICGQSILESYFQKLQAYGENYVFPASSSVTELDSKSGKLERILICASMCLEIPRCDGINVCKNSSNIVCQFVDIQNPISCGDIEKRDGCYFLVKVIEKTNIYMYFIS
jgi:hypothetical protein